MLARVYRAFGPLGPFGPEDGMPLLVVPGFLATDRTTLGLQRAFGAAGYRTVAFDSRGHAVLVVVAAEEGQVVARPLVELAGDQVGDGPH